MGNGKFTEASILTFITNHSKMTPYLVRVGKPFYEKSWISLVYPREAEG